MQTLVLATQKGGSGKTNLARSMAVEAARNGAKVALLDLDPQGSLTRWWKRREADDLELIEGIKNADQISVACATLAKQGFDYLVIDTPGKRDDATRIALESASLVIVPIHPSPDDLDAVGPTVAEILKAKAPFAFVLSRTARSKLLDETIRVAAAHGRLAPVNVAQRVAYSEAAAHGLTGAEMGDIKAADEMARLWDYVKEQVNVEATA